MVVAACTFNPKTQEAEAEFEASQVYRVSSRTARIIQRNPILKNRTKQGRKEEKKEV